MKVPVKLTVFAAALALAFGAAFGVGSVVDPIADRDRTVDIASTDGSEDGEHSGMGSGDDTEDPPDQARSDAPAGSGSSSRVAPAGLDVAGLAVSERGYTLRIEDTTPGSGEKVEVAFSIASPDGGPVLNFRPIQEEEMHLIVVRRDLTGFQHLHPQLGDDGTWTAAVDLSDAGTYRIFADFLPAALGEALTLGADLFVPGEFQPAEVPEPSATWSSEEYEVDLSGTPAAGAESELVFTVSRNGSPVRDLDPYLGAFGYLVAVRPDDLAYLRTQPQEKANADEQGPPVIRFAATFPIKGRYRLYLSFADAGAVRIAEFTVDVPMEAALAAPTGSGQPSSTDASSTDASSSKPEVAEGGLGGQ